MGYSQPRHTAAVSADGGDGVVSSQQAVIALSLEHVVIWLEDGGLTPVLDSLDGQLDAVLEAGARSLVLDMSGLERVSSTTVAALLWTRRRCSSRGIEVSLRHPSRRCLDALARTGLLDVLAVDPGNSSLRRPGPDAGPRHS